MMLLSSASSRETKYEKEEDWHVYFVFWPTWLVNGDLVCLEHVQRRVCRNEWGEVYLKQYRHFPEVTKMTGGDPMGR